MLGELCSYYFRVPVGIADVLTPIINAVWRWRTGADAAGWLPCDGRCGWGVQRRVIDGREQTRRCYSAGYVTPEGECLMAKRGWF